MDEGKPYFYIHNHEPLKCQHIHLELCCQAYVGSQKLKIT